MKNKEKVDPVQVLADRLIEQMKTNTAPWQKPWESSNPGHPYNASTNPYGCEGTPIANRLSNCRQVFIDNNLVYYILIYDIVEELSKLIRIE